MQVELDRRTTPARWAGYAGIVAGLAWSAVALLREASSTQPVFGLTHEDVGRLTPALLLMLIVTLHGLHRLHRGRAGRLEAWGYRVAMTGFVLTAVVVIVQRWLVGEAQMSPADPTQRTPGLELVLALVIILLPQVGLILLGTATWRARVLPVWALPLPLLLPLADLVSRFGSGLPSVTANTAVGVLWALMGLALVRTSIPAAAATGRPSPSFATLRGAFLSRGTLISGVLAVGAWSLEWNWVVGVWVVLLLYVHELGHVVAAFWRGVEVKRAPIFLPGLGAFVETGPRASAWDDSWISLGGPLVGGACALVVKVVGMRDGNAALAHAGDFALIVNLLNLAPFSPLDGGRVALRTGWLGLLLTLGLGAFLLFQGIGLFLSALVVLGGLQAFASATRAGRSGWGTHFGIMALYVLSTLVLLIAVIASDRVTWLPSDRPSWLPSLSQVFEVVFWIWLASLVALPYAWRPDQSALVRYGLAAAVGWPRFLLERRVWMIGVCFANLGRVLGLPTGALVEHLSRRMARSGDAAAGAAAAYGFDCRVRMGDADADAWLDRLGPALREGGPGVVGRAYETLVELGYTASAERSRQDAAAAGIVPILSPAAANERAWALLGQGRAQESLELARMGVAGEPHNSNFQDTLGQVLLAIGEPAEAETVLRSALAGHDRVGTRVALARALAAQGRFADAAREASAALGQHRGAWPADEPDEAQIRTWLGEWQAQAPASTPDARSGVLPSNV